MARSSGFESGDLADAALHVLLALVKPRHGYAVMQFLEQESRGAITLGPASLYTTLKKLVGAGLIEELDGDDSRRVYHLNAKGHEVLVRNIQRRRQLLAMADHIMEEA
ncbi:MULTISPECIES: PadR family transcriptional regulator [Arthrobacter]|uniref:PadR family transcriptional regulator n=1 Tax=Arthrobacter sunyaminii TaxID=2816859 RepID=A0A975S4E2_9MICC|nr:MULTISPECIES: PadR family transcriptional regulator [Arthrobacter]MBO0895839.1 PadR family transcriptional regulator [Arthrobacter sunyaminii]MBO0907492.1 PadR family transcriptional regulator [Arthrobacter sunyaminii]QWQ35068.1 PadR family transcriptional regulator [Arthrobacter sunyaminii]